MATLPVVGQSPQSEQRSADDEQAAPVAPVSQQLGYWDLLRLLGCLEGELQARDVVIAALKAERAKQLLAHARYGRLGFREPLAALQRDSELSKSDDPSSDLEVTRVYESQLTQLERLISSQRKAHERARELLAMVERKHLKTLRDLDQERRRRKQDAAQGDDVYMMLEKEREKLQKEVHSVQAELEQNKAALEKCHKLLDEERSRHKEIVLYLLRERHQLMVKFAELRVRLSPPKVATGDRQSIGTSVEALKKELEECQRLLEEEKSAKAKLEEVVKNQEEDLQLIRQTILAKAKQSSSDKATVKAPKKYQSAPVAAGDGKPVDRRWTGGAGGRPPPPPPPPPQYCNDSSTRYALTKHAAEDGMRKTRQQQYPAGQRATTSCSSVADQPTPSLIPQHNSKRLPQPPTEYSALRSGAPPSYSMVQQYGSVVKDQWTVNMNVNVSTGQSVRRPVVPDRQVRRNGAPHGSTDGHQVCNNNTNGTTWSPSPSGGGGGGGGVEYVEPEIAQLEAVINSLIMVSSANAEEQQDELEGATPSVLSVHSADEAGTSASPMSSNSSPGLRRASEADEKPKPPPPVPHKSSLLKATTGRSVRTPPTCRKVSGKDHAVEPTSVDPEPPPSRIRRISTQKRPQVRATQV